jgi:hypothetical protein
MKKFLLAMTAVSALATAAPAAAQYRSYGYSNVGAGFENRIGMLRAQLQAGMQQGTIDQRQARRLNQQINALTRLEYQYGRDGLSRNEMADLQQRELALREQVQYAVNSGYDRYGRGNRYGNYQNGNYGNGYYGQGGPYEDQGYGQDNGYYGGNSSSRGGILGSIVNGILGGGSARVGQRAPGDLGGVPYGYQDQFRDGGGVYYRSDGRAIYQIDARSNTVVRIFQMNR